MSLDWRNPKHLSSALNRDHSQPLHLGMTSVITVSGLIPMLAPTFRVFILLKSLSCAGDSICNEYDI